MSQGPRQPAPCGAMRYCSRLLAAAPLLLLSAPVVVSAQEAQPAPPDADPPAMEQRVTTSGTPCVQPASLVGLADYNGPFAKVAGTFARKLERKAVHPPRYKPGLVVCSLETGAKFMLFLRDSADPISVFSAGFNAGLDQASNTDPSFGQGGLGYTKRLGANFAGQTASRFFGDFLYPTIFSQDPRYYRMGHGSKKARLLHAMSHTVVARRDNGGTMFNFTEWLGTSSSVALNNLYHPGNQPGVAAAAQNGAINVVTDMGFDVLREFWPEVARKLNLPFRGVREE
jgi:hypothetical protein